MYITLLENCRKIYFAIEGIFLKTDINQNLISVDCRWSDWTQGECSVTCGDGVRQNHRFKEQVELYGGARCGGVAAQTKACINRICPGENKCKTGKPIWADIFKKDVLDIHSKKISLYSRTMLRSKQCSTKMFGPVCERPRCWRQSTLGFYDHLR